MELTITIENVSHAAALSVFLKRVTFDDAYRRSDGDTETARKEMAYRILRGLSAVETGLNNAGFSPR